MNLSTFNPQKTHRTPMGCLKIDNTRRSFRGGHFKIFFARTLSTRTIYLTCVLSFNYRSIIGVVITWRVIVFRYKLGTRINTPSYMQCTIKKEKAIWYWTTASAGATTEEMQIDILLYSLPRFRSHLKTRARLTTLNALFVVRALGRSIIITVFVS